MKVEKYLPRLRTRHVNRMGRLIKSVYDLNALRWRERDRLIARCSLEGMNTFERYCRFLYLSSALGAKDGSGTPVLGPADRAGSVEEAITLAVETVYPTRIGKGPFDHRSEPDWKNPSVMIKVFAALGSTNEHQVSSALSADTDAMLKLPTFRNFYAHRGASTAAGALGVGARMAIIAGHPSDVLTAVREVDHLLTEWLFDIQTVIDLMV